MPTNKEVVEGYIDDVIAGREIASKHVIAACQRHLDDLAAADVPPTAGGKGFYFDEREANRAIDFARLLKHSTGEYAGQPFELTPFQKFIVWCLFGWRRVADGMRRFRRAFITLGSGNGKSPFVAFIVLLTFAFDSPIEPRAEAYCLATTIAQTKMVFDEVKRFRANDRHLKKFIGATKNNLHILANGSKCEPLGAEGNTADGLVPHVVAVDELHRWREHHRELWDMITQKMGKRRQPLLIAITTAGDENSELWLEQYNIACRVVERDNTIEANDLFVFIAQIDDDDDMFDERVWPKANPMLKHGVVKIDDLRSAMNLAKIDPRQKNRVMRFRMNRQVTSKVRAITSAMWAKGNQPLPDLTGRQCRAGFDWGWREDLTSMCYVFPLDPLEVPTVVDGVEKIQLKRRIAVLCDTWIPEDGSRNLMNEPWAGWINHPNKYLTATPGEITDTETIYATIAQRQQQFGIESVAVDPNNAREFGERVERDLGIKPYWFGQSCGKYNEPTRELISMCHEGRIIHGGNPLLAWAVMNVILKTDAKGYQMPDKKKSKDKIDSAVALVMALSEIMFSEQAPKATGKVYAI